MPYRREGRKILHKKGGKWTTKQVCGSVDKAKRALNLLHGVESGEWKPTGKPARKKKGKK